MTGRVAVPSGASTGIYEAVIELDGTPNKAKLGANCFAEALMMCSEVYHFLKKVLKGRVLSVSIGDEGVIKNAEEMV